MADNIIPARSDAKDSQKSSKRFITPARKEQNRIAQRTFRQRQKAIRMARKEQQQQQQQQQHKATDPPKPILARVTDDTCSSGVNNGGTGSESTSRSNRLQQPSSSIIQAIGNLPQPQSDGSMVEEPIHDNALSERFLLDELLPNCATHALPEMWDSVDPTLLSGCNAGTTPLDLANTSGFLATAAYMADLDHIQAMEYMTSAELNLPSASLARIRQLESPNTSPSGLSPLLAAQNGNESTSTATSANDAMQVWKEPLSHTRNRHQPVDYEHGPGLSDPYLNAIQFSHFTILQICISNAYSLGLPPERFVGPDCLTLCSPFYKATTTISDDPDALLKAVSNPSFPKYLQPTLTQILFPHHPMLDLIPIPEFREKAIMLSSTCPAILDPMELKRDILHGGLLCWGSRHNAHSGGKGQPWDLRSWEAAPWFLQKWRLLVGGKEGELWKQSLWWQNLRGENIDAEC